MLVEWHDNLRRPEKRTASRFVVYDNFGNAIAVFLEVAPGHIYARFVGQKGFREALRLLGIEQTTIVDNLSREDVDKIVMED